MSEDARGVARSSLAGIGVILTRPKHQCDALLSMLRNNGARARCLPVVEIEAPKNAAEARIALSDLTRFDIAVFTSANAVRGALSLGANFAAVQDTLAVAAVGPATRQALEAAGIHVSVSPEDEFSSEGLLRHPMMAPQTVRGKQVLIVKGAGGRGLLADSLTAAGATVTKVDVYRRSRPEGRIRELLDEPLESFHIIVFTSGTAIEHLLELANETEKRQILGMPSVVSSERIARVARRHGVRRTPFVAAGPGDEALVSAIESWKKARQGNGNSNRMELDAE